MKNKLMKEYKYKLDIIDNEIIIKKDSIKQYRNLNMEYHHFSDDVKCLNKQRQLVVQFLKDLESL